jgi:LPS-assembly protein
MAGAGRMRRWRYRLGGLLFIAAVAAPSGGTRGQDLPVSLIADQVTYDRDTRQLTAAGNVEVLYQGRVLRAERIVYDEAADEIRAEGPLVLTDPAGGVLIAESAALTPDLTEGLITSARLLIAGKMQLAAAEVRRSGGRYETLYRTIASSCTICAENPTPTWALRASRVTRDEEERRIYLENARLELFGLPVALLPRLSIPEPGVERASGFLEPHFQQSDIYGFGIKTPYYYVLGPSADATVTPFVTTGGAALIEGEYRQRFANGGFDFWGVFALDDAQDDGGGFGRGAFHTTGDYSLPRGFEADFDLSAASDDSFRTQFDYSDTDLLTSFARIRRTRAEEYIELGTLAFQSLTEVNESVDVPFVLPRFSYRRLRGAPGVDGRLGVSLNSLGILRETGSNSFRAGGQVDWQRDVMLPHGSLASGTAEALVDFYQVWENPTIADGLKIQAAPTLAAELRWPLVRHTGAAAHVIEPIAQVVYVRALEDQNEIPNEDSQLPEFDETNLFAFNRFPGLDRLETGLRANLGVSYTRQDPSGWSMGVTLGRILRADQVDEFSAGTGLDGRWSDYVGAVSLDFAWGLTMVNRALFGTGGGVRRNEFALAYDGDFGALRAAYIYLAENNTDPVLGPQPETNEISLDARYRVRPNWELRGLWRYDVAAGSNLRAGAGITYGNECAEFDLSVSRRYTSSDSVPPSTSIGFSLRLAGIGEKGQVDWPARVCMRGT